MTFSVRVRITNDATEAARAAGAAWLDNPDMKALATLCNADPLVSADKDSYVLSASDLDAIDDSLHDGRLIASAETMLKRVNGAARLLLNQYMTPARLTGQIQTSKAQSVALSATAWAYAPRDFATLDPRSCAIVLAAADANPLLDGVLMLLGIQPGPFIWFDLWRVWEVLRKRVGTNADLRTWVGNPQICFDFERAANDPAVSGAYARHGVWTPTGKAREPRTGSPVGQPMSPDDAKAFVLGLVRRWIEEETGRHLIVEAFPPQ